jgi:hypothetical protein
MECSTKAPIWLSAFHAIQVAKTATESLIPAAQTVHLSLGISRLSRRVFLMDLAPMGIIRI